MKFVLERVKNVVRKGEVITCIFYPIRMNPTISTTFNFSFADVFNFKLVVGCIGV